MTTQKYRSSQVKLLGVGYIDEIEIEIGNHIIRMHSDEARELWIKLGGILKEYDRQQEDD